jgi:hypothetical protein
MVLAGSLRGIVVEALLGDQVAVAALVGELIHDQARAVGEVEPEDPANDDAIAVAAKPASRP